MATMSIHPAVDNGVRPGSKHEPEDPKPIFVSKYGLRQAPNNWCQCVAVDLVAAHWNGEELYSRICDRCSAAILGWDRRASVGQRRQSRRRIALSQPFRFVDDQTPQWDRTSVTALLTSVAQCHLPANWLNLAISHSWVQSRSNIKV
jgi:hypothetical protein